MCLYAFRRSARIQAGNEDAACPPRSLLGTDSGGEVQMSGAEMNTEDLEALAQDLVIRVRDDDPDANGRWLAAVTSEEDRWALLFMLAAAVPDDRPWRHLTMWTYGTGGPDTARSTRDRRMALLEEEDMGRREAGPAAVGANQFGRKRRAA